MVPVPRDCVQEMAHISCTLRRSMAESYAPADWKKALTGRQFERSGMQAYGAAKLFNIMLAKEYSKRLKVCHIPDTSHPS